VPTHPSAVIDSDVEVGVDTHIWHFVHISTGARIGARCSLGQNVFVGRNVRVGEGVRVQNNVSIFEGVEIEDEVFLGPSCVFTNVKNPRAAVSRQGVYTKTLVKRGASVGANATIVCGVTLGEYCFIGAGTVVTRDVPPFALIVGNPGRQRGWVCSCGEALPGSGHVRCEACGRGYAISMTACERRDA
jgi:UDP-2-acetamido-3-amino-2,3-dideoxy-glucuronate N-acetyltransferase